MTNNLHISYDLKAPNRDYSVLTDNIKKLDNYAKIHKSFWYVKAPYTAKQVVEHLSQFIDSNDTIYVVDVTNNDAAWQNISPEVEKYINSKWHVYA